MAGRLPYFGLVLHRGRSTGRVYRTPVNAFPHGNRVVIALTYGHNVDWVKNVIAADGCRLVHRGRTFDLGGPRIVPLSEEGRSIPSWVRAILFGLGVDEALRLIRA